MLGGIGQPQISRRSRSRRRNLLKVTKKPHDRVTLATLGAFSAPPGCSLRHTPPLPQRLQKRLAPSEKFRDSGGEIYVQAAK